MSFSLEKFEALSYRRSHEEAMRELIALLQTLENHYGHVGPEFAANSIPSIPQELADQHIWTRAASAASCLLSDQALQINPAWRSQILAWHRWLGALFAATPFRNADHVMRGLHVGEDAADLQKLRVNAEDLLKLCLVYSQESEVPLDLDALWEADKVLAASLCLVLISPRFLASPAAHGKREVILPWLAERLDQIEDIEMLPIGVMHDLYMHCSYADRADKHDIKKPINALIRRKLKDQGLTSLNVTGAEANARLKLEKPVMLVVLEWFTKGHSIYRTHSRTMEAARERFKVVGLGYPKCSDELTREVFDDFVELDSALPLIGQLLFIQKTASELKAAVCYMPSVGMFPLTMWLANLQVAPLQMMALGHPATTHSDAINWVVVEEDYVGSEACFSEKLLKLPKDGMPYRPSAAMDGWRSRSKYREKPKVVQIGVCSTTMKLNPRFLSACARIFLESKQPVHFHFLIGQNQGLVRPNVDHVIRQFLGDNATIYPHQEYAAYMDAIDKCDMFINPFPFGNTNGIIDTVSAGLVGVCLTGPEVHEHIDQGLFERLGLPQWMVAKTVDEYVLAACRLAENHEERVRLCKEHSGLDKVEVLFEGRPEVMGELFREKLSELKATVLMGE